MKPGAQQQYLCKACGLKKLRKGSKFLAHLDGICCVDCLPDQLATLPPKEKPAPKVREHEDKGPWRPSTVQQPPTAPAQRATSINVIRDDTPRLGKYGVAPSEVAPYFPPWASGAT